MAKVPVRDVAKVFRIGGHVVEICQREVVQGDAVTGRPESSRWVCRDVCGFVDSRTKEYQLSGGAVQSIGTAIAYLLAEDIPDGLPADSAIRFRSVVYNPVKLDEIAPDGRPVIQVFELREWKDFRGEYESAIVQ